MTSTFLTRPGAADYLSGKLGRRVTVGSLHRMASDDTGPGYVMALGRASYRVEDLDAWVEQIIKAPTKRPRATSLARDGDSTAVATPAAG